MNISVVVEYNVFDVFLIIKKENIVFANNVTVGFNFISFR